MILNKKLVALWCLSISIPFLLTAKPGCKEISLHLSEQYDPKVSHYVSCTCPCEPKNQAVQGTLCLICEHTHDPQPELIVPEVVSDKERYTGYLAYYPASQKVLQTLIQRMHATPIRK